MRIIFVNWAFEDHGSAQDLSNYVQVGKALGHDIALYGRSKVGAGLDGSLDVASADAVVFIFEYSTYLEALDAARLVSSVPRERRVVLDCDGGYNDSIRVNGDVNHTDSAAGERWVEVCDSLSDKIFQPTFHPLRPNVGSFFFHAYNPAWETPLDPCGKDYGMCYVGNTWFRWRGMREVLRAIEPVRDRVGRILLIGRGWDGDGPWAGLSPAPEAYATDREYLDRLGVEVSPPVPFHRVIDCMGKGTFMPVIYRPLFDHLRLVTCRTFETPAANTIPLFCQEPDFVAEVYGEEAVVLVLPRDNPHERILELVERPEAYVPVVEGIRRRLRERYSYATQLQRLTEIIRS
jgi:hypothetical protein